ncbi:MAG: polysaccharide biosynthesis/export family protein [Moraxellaceae bacterium]|nr:polysaccharide biosynthesis/export family protein [Moraxellaceae bacterium]MDZ4386036.1 polysaccharide biosynthesis/export family protein [Moraxellaceae bacterium]
MHIKRLFPVAVMALSLSACVFAPGQYVSLPNPIFHGGNVPDDAPVQVIPLSAKVIALQEADKEEVTLPEALLSYQPSVYRIGVGDQILVTIWEHPQLTNPGGTTQNLDSASRLVREDGTMFYPYAGNVLAAGKTVEELRTEITSKLARVLSSPQVDVSLARTNSQRIAFSGAFVNKTPLNLTTVPVSLSEALGRATVESEKADFSNLTLTRDGQVYVLDLDKLTQMGAPLADVFLKPGDSIHLPYNDQKKIYLMGELRAPKSLTYRTSSISLADAIGQGGSALQTSAKSSAVYVIRNTSADPAIVTQASVYQLDLNDPLALVMSDRFQLKAGDVVYIGAPGIVRWNRFISQLFPSLGLVNTATNINN